MKRFAKVLLLVLSLCHFAVADELRPSLDNESFSREFVGKPPNGDKLIEYVREGESFEKWTKLILISNERQLREWYAAAEG